MAPQSLEFCAVSPSRRLDCTILGARTQSRRLDCLNAGAWTLSRYLLPKVKWVGRSVLRIFQGFFCRILLRESRVFWWTPTLTPIWPLSHLMALFEPFFAYIKPLPSLHLEELKPPSLTYCYSAGLFPEVQPPTTPFQFHSLSTQKPPSCPINSSSIHFHQPQSIKTSSHLLPLLLCCWKFSRSSIPNPPPLWSTHF